MPELSHPTAGSAGPSSFRQLRTAAQCSKTAGEVILQLLVHYSKVRHTLQNTTRPVLKGVPAQPLGYSQVKPSEKHRSIRHPLGAQGSSCLLFRLVRQHLPSHRLFAWTRTSRSEPTPSLLKTTSCRPTNTGLAYPAELAIAHPRASGQHYDQQAAQGAPITLSQHRSLHHGHSGDSGNGFRGPVADFGDGPQESYPAHVLPEVAHVEGKGAGYRWTRVQSMVFRLLPSLVPARLYKRGRPTLPGLRPAPARPGEVRPHPVTEPLGNRRSVYEGSSLPLRQPHGARHRVGLGRRRRRRGRRRAWHIWPDSGKLSRNSVSL